MKLTKNAIQLLISSALLSSVLTACSTTTDPAEAYKGETQQQIYNNAEKELRDRNYGESIKRFEALDVQYPYGPNTETSQLHIIYAYYMQSDYASAEAAADRFIRAYPTSPHVDYAYYMRGLSNYYQNLGIFERIFALDLAKRDLSQAKKSYADFSEIVKVFPNSPYAPAAHQYMVYLRNVMAKHVLEVAQYYYGRQAYVAAANRANEVVQQFQGAPSVPEALVIMVKSYRALQLTKEMNDAMRVLEVNYPGSDYVKQASE